VRHDFTLVTIKLLGSAVTTNSTINKKKQMRFNKVRLLILRCVLDPEIQGALSPILTVVNKVIHVREVFCLYFSKINRAPGGKHIENEMTRGVLLYA